MKRTLLTAFIALFALLPVAAAQQDAKPLTLAFIQTTKVLAAHPDGKKAAELTDQARTELADIQKQLQTIAAKAQSGQQLTSEEQSNAQLLDQTLRETQARYQKEIQAAAQPAEDEINKIITEIAEKHGYALVLNKELAATSSLVVYGSNSIPDITDEAIKAIQAAQ